jgi:predicted RNase H-like nuclease (RuvC/YqgF family)
MEGNFSPCHYLNNTKINLFMDNKVNKLKSQIKALNNRLKEGKSKNIYSLQNKIKSLKMQLNIEMERYAWENYLSK